MFRLIINKLTGRRPDATASWPQVSAPAPDIHLSRGMIGPVRFGDALETARVFGRPSTSRWAQAGYLELVYADAGFQIDFESGRLAYAAFFIGADSYLPVGASFSRPRLIPGGSVSSDATQKAIEAAFGAPKLRDSDAQEAILFYEKEGLTLEFEFAPSGHLKRLNVYPTERA